MILDLPCQKCLRCFLYRCFKCKCQGVCACVCVCWGWGGSYLASTDSHNRQPESATLKFFLPQKPFLLTANCFTEKHQVTDGACLPLSLSLKLILILKNIRYEIKRWKLNMVKSLRMVFQKLKIIDPGHVLASHLSFIFNNK